MNRYRTEGSVIRAGLPGRRSAVADAPILYALCLMWNQYCPPPHTHYYMTAGEQTQAVLQQYGLLNGDVANEELLEKEFAEYIYP